MAGWNFTATGTGIMITALVFLVTGGIIYNNLVSSGFSNPAEASTCNSIQCPTFGQTAPSPIIICSTPTQCQVGKPTFLNQNSPWTYLLTGDLSGFLASFTQAGSSPGINAFSLCTTNQGGTSFTFLHCTSESSDLKGAPQQPFPIVSCNLKNPSTAYSNGFNATTNGAPYSTPNISNLSQWTIIGCQPATGANGQPTNSPNNNTGAITFLADYAGSGSGTNGSIGLIRFRPGLTDIAGSGGNQFQFITFIGFIVSVILFIMSWGISFNFIGNALGSGAGAGFSSNAQGTRFAQVASFALIIFLPLYSEFGTWILAMGSKFGLDILVTSILFMVLFFGIWTQTTSGTSAS